MLCLLLFYLFMNCFCITTPNRKPKWDLEFVYHNYEDMTEYLREVHTHFYPLARLYSIGTSIGHRELWVMEVSGPIRDRIGVPNVKIIGNIHGNEAVGRELILHFIHYLTRNYQIDEDVRWLLDNTRVHLLPSMNPDGFEESDEGSCTGTSIGRTNEAGYDLNRNFPDYFTDRFVKVQPETLAIKNWMSNITFVLSASLHGGSLVANYPFDNSPQAVKTLSHVSEPSLTPDNDVFVFLAKSYSNNHKRMYLGNICDEFPGGITNGAAWYPLTGGMQDYNYIWHGCMELTLEISCCKYPPGDELLKYWDENKKSLLEFVKLAHLGVRGTVLDAMTADPISTAVLHVSGRNVSFGGSNNGEFWRILLPGKYVLEVRAEGYLNRSIPFTVHHYDMKAPSFTWLNVYMLNETQAAVSASVPQPPVFLACTISALLTAINC